MQINIQIKRPGIRVIFKKDFIFPVSINFLKLRKDDNKQKEAVIGHFKNNLCLMETDTDATERFK